MTTLLPLLLPLPLLLLLFPLQACGDRDAGNTPSQDGGATDGGGVSAVDRGPTAIAIDGDPNGLWWEDGVLYIADDDNNRLLRWTDAGGVGLVGELPPSASGSAGLGQVVRLASGSLLVSRFGNGTEGGVLRLDSDGSAGAIEGLDVERRRIGLALAQDGTVYGGWFYSESGTRVGAVSRVDLAGGEVDVIEGLGKPVGVLAVGATLFVADQDQDMVYSAPLSDLSRLSSLAAVEDPDLLCSGPDGSVLTGGKNGELRQIGSGGALTTLASGHQEIRGCAWDEANRRIFFVDHDADDADGSVNTIQIVPVD